MKTIQYAVMCAPDKYQMLVGWVNNGMSDKRPDMIAKSDIELDS